MNTKVVPMFHKIKVYLKIIDTFPSYLFWKVVYLFKKDKRRFTRKPFVHRGYAYKIFDWQYRERHVFHVVDNINKPTLKDIKKVHRWVLTNFKYIPDKGKDYWETSDEVIQKGGADCEGLAALMMRKLRELGIPDEKLGICIIPRHAFATYWYKDDDFYILDNGYMTYHVVKASEFSWKKGEPLCGFNLSDVWSF